MPYGLKDIELAKLNEVFAANERIECVVLYGSRAKGNYKPFSDVDITLEGAGLTLTDLSRLSLAIDDLLLPYLFDISIFHTLKNEALIDHIHRMGITIYEKKSEWKEYKLGDLTIDGKGSYGIAASAIEFDASKYTYLRITDINDDGTINKNGLKSVDDVNASNYLLKPNDIVFARTGASVGRSYFYDGKDGEFVYAGFLIKFGIDPNKVNPKILKYYTHSQPYYDWILSVDNGATRGNINAQTYSSMPIILPERNIQDKIVSILSSLDDKIDLLHRENKTLEAMAETLFRQWFIEEAKEDWEEVSLEDIAYLSAGGDKPKNVSYNRTNELNIPIYSNGIENEGLYGYTDIPKITEESVTISARGTIGYVVLRTEPFVPIVRLITLTPKKNITSKYLYFWAKSQDINGTGTTQQQLTIPDFKLTKILLPEKEFISKFTNEVDKYYKKILLNKQQIQTLIQQRDSLLPKLMSGEVKI